MLESAAIQLLEFSWCPGGIYLFKQNNANTRTNKTIWNDIKQCIKWCHSGAVVVDFQQISRIAFSKRFTHFLTVLIVTPWTSKCQLAKSGILSLWEVTNLTVSMFKWYLSEALLRRIKAGLWNTKNLMVNARFWLDRANVHITHWVEYARIPVRENLRETREKTETEKY